MKAWLETEGFPFEMYVARCFLDSCYSVRQSSYYIDEASKKAREIDVTAERSWFVESCNVSVKLTFVVECKTSRKQPWVLLLTNPPRTCAHEGAPSHRSAADANGEVLLSNLAGEALPAEGLYAGPASVAYGTLSALRPKNKDAVDQGYAAPLAIAKASRVMQKAGIASPSFLAAVVKQHEARWWVPLVVLDGELCSAVLTPSLALEVKDIGWGRLLQSNPEVGSEETIVDIVTRAQLPQYLQCVEADLAAIASAIHGSPKLATDSGLALRKLFETVPDLLARSRRLLDDLNRG